jgi:large subunit ribosomal protein L17
MRHGKKFNHLGRTTPHRKAMLANMACSLILHKRINTTLAKAKALRVYVEPLITKSKDDSTHSRRTVFSYLQDKEAVAELFREVSVKIADRPGGYTRILKTGNRLGDNADMCMMELVDYNENLLGTKEAPKAKTTRRKKAVPKKTDDATPVSEVKAPKKAKAKVEEKVENKKVEEKAEAKVEAEVKPVVAKAEETPEASVPIALAPEKEPATEAPEETSPENSEESK